jgi:hypothetical protein
MDRRRRLFLRAKRKNLWESSSEDEEEPAASAPPAATAAQPAQPAQPTQPNVVLIDLSGSPIQNEPASQPVLLPPGPASWPAVEQAQAMLAFVPRTLSPDSRRYRILPAFPGSLYNEQPTLLLANVPRQ